MSRINSYIPESKLNILDFYDTLLYRFYGTKIEKYEMGYKLTYYSWNGKLLFDELERMYEA